MSKRGTETRTQILDAAERLFLTQGYGGASVEAILGETGLTKGAFFHHFASKQELARAVLDRYAMMDRALLEQHVELAERLSRDPLQQVLIVVGLYEEKLDRLTEPYPGCLFASYCYQAGLFDDDTLDVARGALVLWRDVIGGRLRAALAQRAPRIPVDADELADTGMSILEGAFVLSKTLNEPVLVARQLRHYRNYLELVFGLR